MKSALAHGLVVLWATTLTRLTADELSPPPTVEELQRIHWTRRPCVEFLEHYRRASEAMPRLATEVEALTLKNESDSANLKIQSGLGRLPGQDDEVDWDATIHRSIVADPATLNPLFQSTLYDQLVNELLFSVIAIGPDWKFDHMGDLEVIESWETSEDRLMDKIVFRDDLSWSDGTALTAYDVEFSFKLIMDPKIRIPSYRSLASGLRAVKAYDARTVVYFQKQALPTNHTHLAWPIVPQHILSAELASSPTLQNAKFNRTPVTNGPYRLIEWKPNQEIILERREEWFKNARGEQIRHKPFLKRVHFKVLPDNSTRLSAFETGAIEEMQLDPTQWARGTNTSSFDRVGVKVRGDEWVFAFIGWNAKSNPPNPFFDDRRVRLALALALDHEHILKNICQGLYRPGEGIFHPMSWMAAKGLKPIQRDLDQAEKLLAEAGWKDSDGNGVLDKLVDGKLIQFEFSVACPPVGNGPKVAELMEANYKKLGIKCRLEPVDPAKFSSDLLERKFQAFLMAWGTGTDPDTASNIWTTEAIQGGRNYVGFSNSRVDELFKIGRTELNTEKRALIYAEIDQIIYHEHPITTLFYQPTLWAFSKSIRGYHHSPRGFYRHSPGFYSLWKKKIPKVSPPDPKESAAAPVGIPWFETVLAALIVVAAIFWLRRRRGLQSSHHP